MAQRVAAALRLAKAALTGPAHFAIPSISGEISAAGVEPDVRMRTMRFYFFHVRGKVESDAMLTLADALEVQGFLAQRIVKILIIDYLLDLIEQGATV
jgi:hypothetical protein